MLKKYITRIKRSRTYNYIRNCIVFRKELTSFYDTNFDLCLLRKTIEQNREVLLKKETNDFIKEVQPPFFIKRKETIRDMERAIHLLHLFGESGKYDDVYEYALQTVQMQYYIDSNTGNLLKNGELVNTADISDSVNIRIAAAELVEKWWNELWDIVKGDRQNNGILTWWD